KYPTITEALKFSNIIYLRNSITEDITISGNNVTIIGSDTGITIKGKLKITDSKVTFRKLNIYGNTGISYEERKIYLPEKCPSQAKNGTDGDTACIIINSKISLRDVTIRGGRGGKGEIFWECDSSLPPEEECYICKVGSNGKEGLALVAKNNSTIDTLNVRIGKMELDNTSSIVVGSNIVLPHQQKISISISTFFKIKGKNLLFNTKIKGLFKIYNIKGQIIRKENIEGNSIPLPTLPKGIYILNFVLENRNIKSVFVNTR
ncbi:MAG: T9SS type A sorting domain-containing protein, partial [Chitinispirillaceae bacterium]|nr:T9SS type A sorting domain-containing protein [Chitinispirillaceae bacterium]